MLINPRDAISNNWVTFPEWMDSDFRAKCIQPNAIDFTLDALHEVKPSKSVFMLDETGKLHREYSAVQPEEMSGPAGNHSYFKLRPGEYYDFASEFYVELPPGVAALLIVRSTLNRNGIFVTSGLYDQGFKGTVAGVLHNRGGISYIAPRTRIGQLMFISAADSGIMYAGGYNTEMGQHWLDASS